MSSSARESRGHKFSEPASGSEDDVEASDGEYEEDVESEHSSDEGEGDVNPSLENQNDAETEITPIVPDRTQLFSNFKALLDYHELEQANFTRKFEEKEKSLRKEQKDNKALRKSIQETEDKLKEVETDMERFRKASEQYRTKFEAALEKLKETEKNLQTKTDSLKKLKEESKALVEAKEQELQQHRARMILAKLFIDGSFVKSLSMKEDGNEISMSVLLPGTGSSDVGPENATTALGKASTCAKSTNDTSAPAVAQLAPLTSSMDNNWSPSSSALSLPPAIDYHIRRIDEHLLSIRNHSEIQFYLRALNRIVELGFKMLEEDVSKSTVSPCSTADSNNGKRKRKQ